VQVRHFVLTILALIVLTVSWMGCLAQEDDKKVYTPQEVIEKDELFAEGRIIIVEGNASKSIVGGAGQLWLDGILMIRYSMSSDFDEQIVEGEIIKVRIEKGERENVWMLVDIL